MSRTKHLLAAKARTPTIGAEDSLTKRLTSLRRIDLSRTARRGNANLSNDLKPDSHTFRSNNSFLHRNMADYHSDERDEQPLSVKIGTICVVAVGIIWISYLFWTLIAMV